MSSSSSDSTGSTLVVTMTQVKSLRQITEEQEGNDDALDGMEIIDKLMSEYLTYSLDYFTSDLFNQKIKYVYEDTDTQTKPLQRSRASICLTEDRKKLIVFGGQLYYSRNLTLADMSIFNFDTLEWSFKDNDLKLYTNRGTLHNGGRERHTACVLGNKMIVIGGYYSHNTPVSNTVDDSSLSFIRVYDIDAEEWIDPTSMFPKQGHFSRHDHTCTIRRYSSEKGKVKQFLSPSSSSYFNSMVDIILWGGENSGQLTIMTSKDNGESFGIKHHQIGISSRENSTANLWTNPDTGHDSLVVFGGVISNELAVIDLKDYSSKILEKHSTDEEEDWPGRRHGHGAAVHDDKLYVFGGKVKELGYMSDICVYDLIKGQWSNRITPGSKLVRGVMPPGRYRMSTVSHQSQMYIFGGYNGSALSDLHVLNWLPEWTPELHWSFPKEVRDAIFGLMCIVSWSDAETEPDATIPIWELPDEVLFRIFKHLARLW